MPLHQLVYLSMVTGTAPTKSQLQDILAKSVRNNRRLGITGMLLYAHGGYMQLLEGRQADVEAVFERVSQDPRHARITVMLRGPIAQRSFAEWAMAYRCLDEEAVEDLPTELQPLFQRGFDLSRLQARPSIALQVLQHYSQNNGLTVA